MGPDGEKGNSSHLKRHPVQGKPEVFGPQISTALSPLL